MAMMKHREPNMVKWVGVRPAHNGEQATGRKEITGVALEILYSVPATKVLYITYLSLTTRLSVNGVVHASMGVYTPVGGLVQQLIIHVYDIAGQQTNAFGLPFPIELIDEQNLNIYSGDATLDAKGIMYGFLQDE